MTLIKALGILAALAYCQNCHAGEGQPAEVELTITANSDAYVKHEPVIVEWAIINKSSRELKLCGFIESGLSLRYGCKDKAGNVPKCSIEIVDPKEPNATMFPAGATVRGWLYLGEVYDLPPGEFTLNAILDTTVFNNWKGIWSGTAKSNTIKFRVEEPTGEDKKAADRIDKAAVHEGLGAGVALTSEILHREIIALSNSPRFVPYSCFVIGNSYLADSDPGGTGEIKENANALLAVAMLEDCIKKTDNPYFKGLARFYLLRAKAMIPLDEANVLTLPEAEKMIQEVLKEHPNTFAAQEAPKVLEKLKAARKAAEPKPK